VGFVFVPRATGRSTPMTGTDRPNHSYRTILILFALLGAPMAARSDTLEDSAKELARKIVAVLPVQDDVAIEMRNFSSLTPSEAIRIEHVLSSDIQSSGVRTTTNGGAAVQVRVTLSENVKEFVWSAEVRQGDASHVVLMTAPRSSESRAALNSMPMVLRSEKFWEGPERILDAVGSDAGGQNRFVLLLPDSLAIQDDFGAAMSKVMIPSAQSASRNPRGFLEYNGNIVSAVFQTQTCTIALDINNLVECHPTANRAPADYLIDFAPDDAQPIGRGAEFGIVHTTCADGNQVLATSPRDYTQPDSLQAFQIKPTGAVAISNGLEFPGPILALHVAPDIPRAIILNLKTGNYEAYQLSISCAK
jgi:hypothetical protein